MGIPNKGPHNNAEGALLSKLWDNILKETHLDNALDVLVTRYANKSNSMKAMKLKTKSSILKDATSDNMSWKVFVHLLFHLLNVKKFEISIKITHANNDVTIHSVPAINGRINDKVKK